MCGLFTYSVQAYGTEHHGLIGLGSVTVSSCYVLPLFDLFFSYIAYVPLACDGSESTIFSYMRVNNG